MGNLTFYGVWYVPSEYDPNSFDLMRLRDTGTLVISQDSIQFRGKKNTVLIENIKRVSYGKGDLVNSWVKILYGDDGIALLADGNFLGWSGLFGGTKKILKAIQQHYQGLSLEPGAMPMAPKATVPIEIEHVENSLTRVSDELYRKTLADSSKKKGNTP